MGNNHIMQVMFDKKDARDQNMGQRVITPG